MRSSDIPAHLVRLLWGRRACPPYENSLRQAGLPATLFGGAARAIHNDRLLVFRESVLAGSKTVETERIEGHQRPPCIQRPTYKSDRSEVVRSLAYGMIPIIIPVKSFHVGRCVLFLCSACGHGDCSFSKSIAMFYFRSVLSNHS